MYCFSSSLEYGASLGTIVGNVKGPDGSPFMDAFVRAENIKTKITVSVLSDRQGNYRVENLGPGVYDVRATAIGYKSELRQNTKVDAGQPVSLDFDLQKGMVRWTDISIHQAAGLIARRSGEKGALYEMHALSWTAE